MHSMATNEKRTPAPLPLDQALNQIDAFIKKHLVCSMHHRTVLALWVVHTYCYQHFPVTPYLEISSPEGQSGKTVCLGLLEVLCHKPWKPGGVTAACLATRIANQQPALLLDDWHTVLRSSGNQSIVGLLKAGSMSGSYYPEYPKEKDWDGLVFCPKAFAGQGRLPAALAPLCVPIVLRRKRPKEKVVAFWGETARWEVRDLAKSLAAWAEDNSKLIGDLASQNFANARIASLSGPRFSALVPLLTVAGAAGRRWANKALLALHRILSAEKPKSSTGLQLLSDIRGFFALHNDPPKIHAAPLLEYLNGLEERPWKNLTARSLGFLLHDFPIHRRTNQRIGNQQLKGFAFQHFVESWGSYLPHLSSRRSPRPLPAANQVVAMEVSSVPNGAPSVPNSPSSVPSGTPSVPKGPASVPNLSSETRNPNVFNSSA